MQPNTHSKRNALFPMVALLLLIGAALFSLAPSAITVGVMAGLGIIAAIGILLMPRVQAALQATRLTPRGRHIRLLATSMFVTAAATCGVIWWLLAARDAELHRPTMNGTQMILLTISALVMAITVPVAWRWLASLLLSRPVSTLPFFRTTPASMRLLIVLSLVFVLIAPRLHHAIQPWLTRPSLQWLDGLLTLVHWSLAAVVILAILSGISQLLQRFACIRRNRQVPH